MPYMFIFYVIFTCPTSISFPISGIFNLIPSGIFCFSDEEDEQILCLRLIMNNNVRCCQLLRNCKDLANKRLLLFFFFPWVDFSIDQTKFIGWVQRIRAMSLQRRYNIFDIDNNSTIVNYDKWIITFLVSSFIDFNCFVQSEIILARILRD